MPLLTLAVAAWFRSLRGTDLAGRPIEITDVRRDRLVRLARAGGTDPSPLLGEHSVMGSLGDDVVVHRELHRALRDLERVGASQRHPEAPQYQATEGLGLVRNAGLEGTQIS